MYPKDVFPHPRIPTRTIEAFAAKTRVVSTEDVLCTGIGVFVPLEFDAETGLLVPALDIGRLEGFPPSISSSMDVCFGWRFENVTEMPPQVTPTTRDCRFD
jgi:hypothetical protein